MEAYCKLPDGRDWFLPTGWWSWFLSLWWVGLCLCMRLKVLWEHTLMLIPKNLCRQCPSPTRATVKPPPSPFSQKILQELQSGLTQIPMESLLCPGTQRTWKSVFTFQEWGLHFLQSCGAPVHKHHWPSMPNTLGAPSPSARSLSMGNWLGTQNSHSHSWVSVIKLLPSLWAANLVGMGFLISHNSPYYCLDVASPLSSGVGYLFW